MNNDAEKIAQIETILQTRSWEKCFVVMSLALSIEDEEDRNLHLLNTVRWLIQNKGWQQAYGAAQLMTESYEKSEALQMVAEYLVTIGHLEKAFSVYDEAEKYSLTEQLSAWQKAERLHHIAQSLRGMKAYFRADEVWEKAIAIAQEGAALPHQQDSLDAAGVLAEIAASFAETGRVERALSIAQKIAIVAKKEATLRFISDAAQHIKRVA